MFNRIPILALALTLAVLFSNLMMVVEAKTQRVGDECNWKKNCQANANGVGPTWAKGAITCAVPQSNNPETCGSGDDRRTKFYGYVYSNLSSHFTFSWLKALTDVLFSRRYTDASCLQLAVCWGFICVRYTTFSLRLLLPHRKQNLQSCGNPRRDRIRLSMWSPRC